MKIKIPFFSRNTRVVCTTKQVVDIEKKKSLDKILEELNNSEGSKDKATISLNGETIREMIFAELYDDPIAPVKLDILLMMLAEWRYIVMAGNTIDIRVELLSDHGADINYNLNDEIDFHTTMSIEEDYDTDDRKVVSGDVTALIMHLDYVISPVQSEWLTQVIRGSIESIDIDTWTAYLTYLNAE